MTPFLLGDTRPEDPALVWPWPADWSAPVSERLEWRTAIRATQSAKEQRQAQRREPRLSFGFTSLLTGTAAVRLQQALAAWAGRTWAVPAWWAASKVLGVSGAVATLSRPTDTLWPASSWALLWSSAEDCELAQIESVASNSLALTVAPAGAHAVVVPLYFATLEDVQQVSAKTAEVVTVATQWQADPSYNTVLTEANTWTEAWPDGGLPSEPRAHFWAPQGNWAGGVEVSTELPTDLFDPGRGGWSRRANRDLPALQWSQRALLTDDARAASVRRFAAAHRGAAIGFHAANPVADVRVASMVGTNVTWAEALPHDNPGALFDGVLLRGDLLDFSLPGSSLTDATGNHTVGGSGIDASGGWLVVSTTTNATLAPALTSTPGGPWTLQFRTSLGGYVNVGQQGSICTYVNVEPTEYDARMIFAWSGRSIADKTCLRAPVSAGSLVTIRYLGGSLEIRQDSVPLAAAQVGTLTLNLDQFGHWQGGNQFNGSLQAITLTYEQVTVKRSALVYSLGATLADPASLSNITYARLVSPARLASDALEITHHTAGVAEASLAIRTTPTL